jgi:hypothetical protein
MYLLLCREIIKVAFNISFLKWEWDLLIVLEFVTFLAPIRKPANNNNNSNSNAEQASDESLVNNRDNGIVLIVNLMNY